MGSWRMLDLFPKIPTDLSQSTALGGWLSTVTGVLMLLLFHVELFSFLSAPIESSVVVDNAMETKLQINFNLSFLDLSCEFLSVDALDILGSNRVNITGRDIQKWHLDPQGVQQAYHGRNKKQKIIAQFDEGVTSSLEELHRDGVHAVPLTAENFDKWLASHDVTFVTFHAPWCVWCQRLLPTIEALAEVLEQEDEDPEITVATVDCTLEADLCTNVFGIRAFPTMKLFLENKPQPEDYRGDRTVNALARYLHSQTDGTQAKHKRNRRASAREGVHDDQWPGCRVAGFLMVNRVPGNFHVEAASNSHNFHAAMTNLSHIVHHMSFGSKPIKRVANKINHLSEELRQSAPLDGNVYITHGYHQAPHHYIRVVGTSYHLGSMKKPWHGYQAVASSQITTYGEEDVPEARFSYNLSPMSVLVRTERRPWYDFVTKVLAIIGGTFSVIGLIDAAAFRASRRGGRQLS